MAFCTEQLAGIRAGQAARRKDTSRTALLSARCRTPSVASRRRSWDALSTQPALRPCLPTRPQARTATTSSPTTATLMETAVRGKQPAEPGQSTATQEVHRAFGTLVLGDADEDNPGKGNLFSRSAPRSISTNHGGDVENERDA